MYKFRLRKELAMHDEKAFGYEYELWEIKGNPKKVLVRFQDDQGNWREVKYRKRRVESFLKAGDWIPLSPNGEPPPSARQLFDEKMALHK